MHYSYLIIGGGITAAAVQGVLLWNVWGQVDTARRLIAAPGPFQPGDLIERLPERFAPERPAADVGSAMSEYDAIIEESFPASDPPPGPRYALHPHRGLSFLGRRYVSPGLLDRLRGKEIDIYYDRRDLAVIYLFLDGELVGEAYCTEFMGRRVSIWEANATRKADAARAQAATAESLANRQRIQEAATAGRRRLAEETKRLEAQRRLDYQRAEIHPAHVQTALQVLQSHAIADSVPSAPSSGRLSPAKPDSDLSDALGVCLPIRSREEHP